MNAQNKAMAWLCTFMRNKTMFVVWAPTNKTNPTNTQIKPYSKSHTSNNAALVFDQITTNHHMQHGTMQHDMNN
jgi:hypothetical protein